MTEIKVVEIKEIYQAIEVNTNWIQKTIKLDKKGTAAVTAVEQNRAKIELFKST